MNFLTGPGGALFSSGKRAFFLLATLIASSTAPAAPLDDLGALAQLPPINLAKLKQGEIVAQPGPTGDFPRGIFLESCYFIHVPMERVADALLHWDPIQHQDLDVHLYREYALPGNVDAFAKLRLGASESDTGWLLAQTARTVETGEANDLHLTNEEAAFLHEKSLPPSEAWQQILQRRSEALASGGLAAVAPYGSDKSISPSSEFKGLLSLVPKATRHFQPVLKMQPLINNGKAASAAFGFWEALTVRNHTTLQLGTLAAHKEPESWQVIRCVYYPSDTYFMSLNLFQLWPMDGGTLVWQVGMVSAPFRPFLGGIDRFIGSRLMKQATLGTITAFRTDLEKEH